MLALDQTAISAFFGFSAFTTLGLLALVLVLVLVLIGLFIGLAFRRGSQSQLQSPDEGRAVDC
jgi:uncharacterized membrane protein